MSEFRFLSRQLIELLHAMQIEASDAELFTFVLALAAGEIDEDGARRFLTDHTVPIL